MLYHGKLRNRPIATPGAAAVARVGRARNNLLGAEAEENPRSKSHVGLDRLRSAESPAHTRVANLVKIKETAKC